MLFITNTKIFQDEAKCAKKHHIQIWQYMFRLFPHKNKLWKKITSFHQKVYFWVFRCDPTVHSKHLGHMEDGSKQRAPYSKKHKLALVLVPKSCSSTDRYMIKVLRNRSVGHLFLLLSLLFNLMNLHSLSLLQKKHSNHSILHWM